MRVSANGGEPLCTSFRACATVTASCGDRRRDSAFALDAESTVRVGAALLDYGVITSISEVIVSGRSQRAMSRRLAVGGDIAR